MKKQVLKNEESEKHSGCATACRNCMICLETTGATTKAAAEPKQAIDLYDREVQYYYFYLSRNQAG